MIEKLTFYTQMYHDQYFSDVLDVGDQGWKFEPLHKEFLDNIIESTLIEIGMGVGTNVGVVRRGETFKLFFERYSDSSTPDEESETEIINGITYYLSDKGENTYMLADSFEEILPFIMEEGYSEEYSKGILHAFKRFNIR